MAIYQISYDLRKPGKDYARLHQALGKLGAVRILLSDWVIELNRVTAADVRDALSRFIDVNDRLVVVEISDWATYNGIPAGVAFLKRKMP